MKCGGVEMEGEVWGCRDGGECGGVGEVFMEVWGCLKVVVLVRTQKDTRLSY